MINAIAIILIVTSLVLAYTSNALDISIVTRPFEIIMDSAGIELPQASGQSVDLLKAAEQIPGITTVQKYYILFKQAMLNLENSITNFGNKYMFVIALLLLFALKAFISFVPLSATCLISGVVFPFPVALLINFAGVGILLATKYWIGTKLGIGNLGKLMKHSEFLWKYIQDMNKGYERGNPLMLFLLRIVPTVPIGPISQIYGNLHFDFLRFMLISLAGYALKIVSFTVIGCNVADPLSQKFIVPLVIILFISGIAMLTLSIVLNLKEGPKSEEISVIKN